MEFEDTLLSCHAATYRYARSLSRDPAVAEELVQEAYRKALSAAHKPLPPTEENTRAWLFTILRNIWHNEVRKRNRWPVGNVLLEDVPFEADTADVQLIRALLLSEIRDAVDALPEQYREVVLLRDIEGLPYADIARIVGCPAGTVMSRLARARARLRRTLSPGEPARPNMRGVKL